MLEHDLDEERTLVNQAGSQVLEAWMIGALTFLQSRMEDGKMAVIIVAANKTMSPDPCPLMSMVSNKSPGSMKWVKWVKWRRFITSC